MERPLLWWAAAYLLGCWLGAGWMPDPLMLGAVGVAWALWGSARRCFWCTLVAFLCAGIALASHARRGLVDPYRDGDRVDVVGCIDEVPRYGRALLRVGAQSVVVHDPHLHWRDVVRCQGVLSAIDGPRNPLEPDRRQPGTWHQMWPEHAEVVGQDRRFPWSLCLAGRDVLERGIDRLWPGPEGEVLRGLLLGDVRQLPKPVSTELTRTGTSHLMVANGLKVAALLLLLQAALGFLPLDVRVRAALSAALVLWYAGMCGATWPALHATGMVLVGLLAEWMGYEYDAPNALAAVALGLGILDPLAPGDTSFALSFWVMSGLLLLREPLHAVLEGWPPLLRRLVVLTVGVQLVLAPWQAFQDHAVPIGSLLANLLVVPPMELVVMVGLPLALLAGLGCSCFAAGTVVRLLVSVCLTVLGHVPTARLALPGRPAATGRLAVTFLDVNQGDAAVVQLPDGQTLLVDAGPADADRGVDEGERVVAPYLLRAGETDVALAAISHPHLDHYGGLPAVLRSATVQSVVECGLEGSGALWDAYRTSVPHPLRWRAGDTFDMPDQVRLEVLHPGPVLSTQPNNASLVFRLSFGGVSFLFCGDAEKDAEAEMLLRSPGQLASTVLKVPHHGSATSSTEDFLAAVHPLVAVVSVGRHNRFHLPNPQTMARLDRMVPKVYRTDRVGGVVVTTDGIHLWARPTVDAGGEGTAP